LGDTWVMMKRYQWNIEKLAIMVDADEEGYLQILLSQYKIDQLYFWNHSKNGSQRLWCR
jgi:hypothetical protein